MPANSEDLVVVRPTRDRHGDPSGATEHTIAGCVLAPTSSAEDLTGGGRSQRAATGEGDQITSRWAVYTPPGADLRATDRVRRPSDPPPAPGAGMKTRAPWIVVGDAAEWASPFTNWRPGSVVQIERVSG